MKKILLTLLAITSISSYAEGLYSQTRNLYNSDSNNACNPQDGRNLGDHVQLSIHTLDDNKTIQTQRISSSVSCDNQHKKTFFDRIYSVNSFSYVSSDETTVIDINEKLNKNSKTNIATITALSVDSALINNKEYSCLIKNNGNVDLFDTSIIHLECALTK